jgi:hypothetical protein
MMSDLNSVTPKKRKNASSKPLQELSMNNMLNGRYKGSSSKKPLKRRLSISDEEDRELELKFKLIDENTPYIILEDLPVELHRIIISYLPCNELLKRIQLLSRHWREVLLETCFWKMYFEQLSCNNPSTYNLRQPLNLSQKLRKVKLLAERRSKGKQFKAINRITGESCAVRKIYLDVTNAGQDDGLPTSILRELSYLKSINHPNITK